MSSSNHEVDIARNIRVIEWLRTELLSAVSTLFRAMLKGSEELIMEALAGIVIMTYVLARRLGINFARLDVKIEGKLRSSVREDHEVEQCYGDLTAMLKYVSDKKR